FYAKAGSAEWTKIDAEASAGDSSEDKDSKDGKAKPDKSTKSDSSTKDKPSTSPKHSTDKPSSSNAVGAVAPSARPASSQPRPLQMEAPPPSARSARSGRPSFLDKARKHEANAEKPTVDEDLSEEELEWDTSKLPDGLYVLKVVASDAKRNPDDPKTVEVLSTPFTVDNSAPVAAWQAPTEAKPLPATFAFRDTLCWISSAEYRFDDGDWLGWVPSDGLCDRPEETFAAPKLPKEPGDYTLQMRVRDAAGNVLRAEWPVKVAAP
ncbi:MAG: hypothetical protein HZB16_19290, partial [Armatimonadetes bacterium]|nr:hypothetical protein [Armatimonadota bacterium]